MKTIRPLLLALAVISLGATPSVGAERVEFDRGIRPILSDTCYACHGPDEEARQGSADGGLRLDTKEGAFAPLDDERFTIAPGHPETSEIVRRVFSDDENEVMPPADHTRQLTDQQKQLLHDWIQQGAEWSEHWAYVPPHRVEPPEVEHRDRVGNWIDQFILARLEQEGIEPSATADSRTLIRRVYFDLTGLPPTTADVEAFLQDKQEEAWERIVDRLLDSPHFGERMAVHWLDLVRYADTVGYHGDQPVSVSPYRDYVIQAFNDNMPFDRFTREQLGGDLLPNPTQDQLIASGYNRLGMMSAEGGVQPKEYLAKYAADRVRTASTVWLGSTLGCAECHDHKFDPFTTKDFYQFAAFFADIEERGLYASAFADGNWGPKVEITDPALPSLLEPIDAQLAELQQTLQTPTPELAAAQQAWEQELTTNRVDWQPLHPVSVSALHNTELTVQGDDSVLATGPLGDQNTYTVHVETPLAGITGFRVEMLNDESLPNKGPGRGAGGNFILTELIVEPPSANQGGASQAIALRSAAADFEQTIAAEGNPYKAWNAASVIDGDVKGSTWGWAIGGQEGRPHNLIVETGAPVTLADSSGQLVFTLKQNLDILPNFTIGRFRLWATTASQPIQFDPMMQLPDVQAILAVAADARSEEQQNQLAAHYRSIAPLLEPARQKLAELQSKRTRVTAEHTRSSLITHAVEPRAMRVLPRGNWMDESGAVVQPAVPGFLPQFESSERATRLDLADWLTADSNPLTARVFVNRLWKMYFGTGLSKVLDDVGAQGEPPIHAELLDSLAVEFVESGWNIKHMVKLLVMSSTYRQSSLPRDELRQVDPFNRLLARQSRWRLDAEFIRDNILQVSGLLVHDVGGSSVKPYQPVGLYQHLNFPKRTYTADEGSAQYRRGLYTHWQRQFLHPALQCFDAPAREEATAERPRSNTPLAALNLLNDPSNVEAARVFAERAIREGGATDRLRVSWIMQHALSRDASDAEWDMLATLIDTQRRRYADQTSAAKQLVSTGLSPVPDDLDSGELAAWTAVTRTVLNMHEFITRN